MKFARLLFICGDFFFDNLPMLFLQPQFGNTSCSGRRLWAKGGGLSGKKLKTKSPADCLSGVTHYRFPAFATACDSCCDILVFIYNAQPKLTGKENHGQSDTRRMDRASQKKQRI
jgi:hypothetical protein